MTDIAHQLSQLGLQLPPPPQPGGSYLPYRIHGNTLTLAGVISVADGQVLAGKVGEDKSLQEGQAAAQVCALNALATLHLALEGDWDRLVQLVFVSGYVNAVSGFPDSPLVINGASELFAKVLGDRGLHARAAVAVAGLPKHALVEIQVNAEIRN